MLTSGLRSQTNFRSIFYQLVSDTMMHIDRKLNYYVDPEKTVPFKQRRHKMFQKIQVKQ